VLTVVPGAAVVDVDVAASGVVVDAAAMGTD
jgi:hypothetical protein